MLLALTWLVGVLGWLTTRRRSLACAGAGQPRHRRRNPVDLPQSNTAAGLERPRRARAQRRPCTPGGHGAGGALSARPRDVHHYTGVGAKCPGHARAARRHGTLASLRAGPSKQPVEPTMRFGWASRAPTRHASPCARSPARSGGVCRPTGRAASSCGPTWRMRCRPARRSDTSPSAAWSRFTFHARPPFESGPGQSVVGGETILATLPACVTGGRWARRRSLVSKLHTGV